MKSGSRPAVSGQFKSKKTQAPDNKSASQNIFLMSGHCFILFNSYLVQVISKEGGFCRESSEIFDVFVKELFYRQLSFREFK